MRIIVKKALAAVTITGFLLALGLPSAFGGVGEQRAFVAGLENTERAVAAAQAKLDDRSPGVIGQTYAVEELTGSLAVLSAALDESDLAELKASGTDASQRVAALSSEIAGLLADPRLAQVLNPARLADVRASLAEAQASLQVVITELNPSLILWNTLGSMTEVGASVVGSPGTMAIPAAEFVAGRFGGGVLVPADRADPSEQLAFGDYSITPEGTIELWFKQNGYETVDGSPQDGRFHSFWSPDIRPYETRGASLLTYQVPYEGWHFDVWDGTNYVRNTIAPDLAAGDWHHVAFTWSSAADYTEVYLDGSLLNQVNHTLDIAAPTYLPMQFGFDWDANDRGATSVLDNLKIWSEAKHDFSDRLNE